ncbi:MAG: hypothetical protein Q7V02_10375 [Methylophilus sp.]|nr:hypothetical protein [Methylophilus sp.]
MNVINKLKAYKLKQKTKQSFTKDRYRAFYICGGIIWLMALALIKAMPHWPVFNGLLVLIGSTLFMTGFLIWHIPFLYKTWHHEFGKVALSIVHIFILLLSTVCARSLLTQSLGLPGKDFQISLSLLTLLLYLPTWLFIISIIFGISFYLIGMFATDRPNKNASWHFLGSLGTLIILYFVYIFVANSEGVHSMVRVLAFYCDYESAPNYPEVKPNERIAFHENGVISSAWHTNGDVVISVRTVK